MGRRCPDCRALLHEETRRNVRLDVCICGGAWFDLGEVQLYSGCAMPTRPLSAAVATQPTLVRGNCPRCPDAPLQPRQFAGRTVAGCASCRGVWLSRVTLQHLVPAERPPTDTGGNEWWGVAIEVVLDALTWP
jgi:Zn-finger nucleic acid-binding protein